jgi:hypothetical protein
MATEHNELIDDLVKVLNAPANPTFRDAEALAQHSREANVVAYLRLTREALSAAVWIKRYVESL